MTTEPANRAGSLAALLPLVRYGRRYLGRAVAALAALTISSAATLAVPFALRSMIDFGFSKESGGAINVYFLAMGALVVVIALAAATRYYLVTTLGERVVADLRRDVFAHLSRLDASFYDTARTGELVSRLTADTTQIKAAFGASASIALRNLFMFVGATALMIYTSPKLSALVLVAIPVIAAPLIASGRVVRRRSRRAQDTLAEATAFASESLGADAHHAGVWRRGRKSGAFRRGDRRRLWRGARRRRHPFPPHCDCGFARLLQRRVCSVARRARRAGGADERRPFVAIRAVRRPWRDLARRIVAGVERGFRRRRFGGADRRASCRQAAHRRAGEARTHACRLRAARSNSGVSVSRIRARRTSVSWRTSVSRSAPGERVAIVGPSGAGKSTIFQLIMRFYDADAGQILIDGVDVKAVDPKDLRERIAPVQQEAAIFGATVAENIAYGRAEASELAIEEAARRAAADGFVRELGLGYATKLGERGVTLSGGQRQRLAIARAILKDSPILLLDEATSALDAENEALVQSALDDVMTGRTTLVIAHRLATVLKADRILVMEAGRIVEEGDHASLVARNGVYARLGAAAIRNRRGCAQRSECGKLAHRPHFCGRRPFQLWYTSPARAVPRWRSKAPRLGAYL